MAINMQLSAALSKARLVLTLKWRPREENTEADDLTNEKFSEFDLDKRIVISLADVDTSIISDLVQTRAEFELKKEEAKSKNVASSGGAKKRFDKSPW